MVLALVLGLRNLEAFLVQALVERCKLQGPSLSRDGCVCCFFTFDTLQWGDGIGCPCLTCMQRVPGERERLHLTWNFQMSPGPEVIVEHEVKGQRYSLDGSLQADTRCSYTL